MHKIRNHLLSDLHDDDRDEVDEEEENEFLYLHFTDFCPLSVA